MDDQPKPVEATSPQSSTDSTRPEYEFSEPENKIFSALSHNLRAAGWFVILAVVVFHAILIGRWLIEGTPVYSQFRFSYVFWPLMLVLLSLNFLRAAGAFRKIVDTQGRDITHLMDGLKEINEFFWWFPVLRVILVVGVVVGVAVAVAHMLGY